MANDFFNGNLPVVKFGTQDLAPTWVDYDFSGTNSTTDVTAGAGATHVMRKAGLNDTTLSVTVAYKTVPTDLKAILAAVKPGTEASLELGPEGDTVGKPKHVQMFISSSVQFAQNVKKAAVVIKIKFDGADAPTTDINANGAYAV